MRPRLFSPRSRRARVAPALAAALVPPVHRHGARGGFPGSVVPGPAPSAPTPAKLERARNQALGGKVNRKARGDRRGL